VDFSCYCFISVSYATASFTLTGKGDTHGRWSHSPPHTLEVSEYAWNPFQLADNFGFFGSEGWVEYEIPDGTKFRMSFSCPTGNNDNKASITCSGPSSSQYSCTAQMLVGCAPPDWAVPAWAQCQPFEGATRGRPVVALFSIVYQAAGT
jgi:hypothetical protein